MAERRGSSRRDQDPTDQPEPQGATDVGSGELRSGDQVQTALIPGNTFSGRAVQYTVVDGMALFEGDIILGTAEEVAQQTEIIRASMTGALAASVMISGGQFRWPNGTMAFTIDPNLPSQNRVTDAIAHWQSHTRFRFVPRTNETDYVTFRPASECSSSIGRKGGQQFVNLGPNCTTGNAIHEIGHTVGLWHEQSREDRDAFITIHWDKIEAGKEHNFNQHISDGDDVGPYDYGSIMHYPRNAFGINGAETITPNDPNAQIGQRTALSPGDIEAINSLCPVTKAKDIVKDGIHDTIKEMAKDIRHDTRKELITDTIKELLADTRKEPPVDVRLPKPFDPINPGPVNPGPFQPAPFQPGPLFGGAPTGPLPFTVAAAHQAPGAQADAGQLEANITNLDAQLQALAEQLLQLEAARQQIQAQYDQTAALLKQSLDAHDQTSTS